MNFFALNFRPRHARVIFFVAATLCAASSQADSLDFDKVFNDKAEPAQVYFQASYQLGADKHEVQVWRDRHQHLKRRTDDALETFIFKQPKELEWSMVVLDLKRKIRTDIDRTNLYRIGHFTDWFSMSHALSRPAAAYQLTMTDKPLLQEKPVDNCNWYSLTRNSTESKICWSKKYRLPLLITDSASQVQWRVTKLSSKPMAASTFDIHDDHFVRNNANEDIHAD
ncbi:hypothetical protein [Undibacterium sp. TJN19]|uniref:hypothetical protein n=1 Tax=Undibacterium sp. TJN19 TaxID=3413055 RepID=UPI003BF1E042